MPCYSARGREGLVLGSAGGESSAGPARRYLLQLLLAQVERHLQLSLLVHFRARGGLEGREEGPRTWRDWRRGNGGGVEVGQPGDSVERKGGGGCRNR